MPSKFVDYMEAQEEDIIYIPPPINYEALLPLAEIDIAMGMEEPYGLPEDWDYKTSALNPNNETLPQGALGWNPFGDAYYGPGLMGWWNGFYNKLFFPEKTVSADEHLSRSSEKFAQSWEIWSDPNKNVLEKGLCSIESRFPRLFHDI